ncbi:MAG: T9SS type A sorting domain-containing protein, partial [Bacteroidota bacterium]
GFHEAENNIFITANAGNITNLGDISVRAGNEIIVTATGSNEVIFTPNTHLFIHACNHPGNSFRQQNTNPRGETSLYSASDNLQKEEEKKEIFGNENVKYTFYPNPFTEHLHIDFLLEKNSPVLVSVYNSMGQLIEVLAKGNYEAGEHTLLFNNPSVKPGLYFVRLDIGDKHYTKAVLKTDK